MRQKSESSHSSENSFEIRVYLCDSLLLKFQYSIFHNAGTALHTMRRREVTRGDLTFTLYFFRFFSLSKSALSSLSSYLTALCRSSLSIGVKRTFFARNQLICLLNGGQIIDC